jgi:TPR repeat protein
MCPPEFDTKKALFWYEAAAQNGHTESMNILGEKALKKGDPHSLSIALQWFEKAVIFQNNAIFLRLMIK